MDPALSAPKTQPSQEILLRGSVPNRFCLFVFVNSSQTRVTWKEATSVEKMPPSDQPVGSFVQDFLVGDRCEGVQPTAGSATRGKVVLGCVER